MLTVDISLPDIEELQKLVEAGKEKGFLTYDEIVTGVEEVELSKEQLEDFTTYLIDHGVELVEGEQHKRLPHEQPLAEEEKAAPKLDLTVEPSLDSLRLYLREIGKVPLLTADQEIELLGQEEIVRIEKREQGPASVPDTGVAGGGKPSIVLIEVTHARIAERRRHAARVVRRTVVNHQNLVVGIRLREDTANGLAEVMTLVVCRNDDANGG